MQGGGSSIGRRAGSRDVAVLWYSAGFKQTWSKRKAGEVEGGLMGSEIVVQLAMKVEACSLAADTGIKGALGLPWG